MKFPVRLSRFSFIALVLALASCAKPARVLAPEPRSPVPNTPQDVVRAFEWAVNNRSIAVLEELISDDFAFIGAGTDSAGSPTRQAIGDRAWLLARFRCMFEGGGPGGLPPAQSIRLTCDKNLVPQRDTRPGYRDSDSLFRTIRTSVDLTVELGDGQTVEITGYALFYATRGDTVAIPSELAARGFQKDKDRWWISRWEDETIDHQGKPPGATDPTKLLTLGTVLGLFDCTP